MARYGGGQEDFNEEAARLKAMRAEREKLIASERVYQDELAATTGVEAEEARVQQTRRRAKAESREVSQREAVASKEATKQVELDTRAIERNTQARRRNAQEARQQQINVSRAFSGARDPAFGAAYGIRGAETTQYAIRQQLEGVGSRRARAIQEALQLGIRPSGGYEAAAGPVTRAQAALSAKAAADFEAAQATKAYTNATRRKSATAEEVEGALQARETARARARAADVELESARAAEAAMKSNTRAIEQEQRGHEQVQQAQVQQVRRMQQAVVGPELAGGGVMRREPYGLLPAPGQTAQMPLSPLAMGRRVQQVPGDIRETGAGGIVGTPQGDAQRAQRVEQEAHARSQAAAATREQNEELARHYQLTGRAAEAAHVYANVLGDEARAAMMMREAQVADIMERDAKAAGMLGRATRDAGVNFYPLSQAMHRHGALTTEFIAAAARGETTLRELGNQALVTAGKFAGWTVAATAVYGIAGALHSVGEGAIAAQSGAQQASRVITQGLNLDELRGSFADLGREFNVPVDVASDAVYRMGQVFHNQTDAIQAARAALYSYKTGEVDVATSTKNLIAIQQGFQLSSSGLNDIFDQINQAQNTFGISIGDTEAGLAKAAGVYRNAGGDLSYLLAVFVAIQKATGRSGTEIGTGISRAVQRIREPISIEKLQAQGIEVDPQNFQKTLQNALKRASTGKVDIQEVATGLFGNQYARLIAPVLANQDTLNKALQDTSPEASKESAQRELATVLKESREQLAAITNNLQALGVELSRAGVFDVLGAGLKLINGMLSAVSDLVGLFNELPEPIRRAVTYLGQAAAAIAVMRKFGGMERLAGTPLGFLAAPGQRERTFALAGLRESRQQSFNEVERLGRREFQAALERDLAAAARTQFRRGPEYQAYAAGRITDDVERARIADQAIALEQRVLVAEAELERATIRTTAGRAIAARTEADLAAVQAASAAQTRAVLAERQIMLPANLNQPNLAGTVRPGYAPGSAAAAAGLTEEAVLAGGVMGATEGAVRETAQQAQQARRTNNLTRRALINARLRAEALSGGRELGRSYAAMEGAVLRAGTALETGAGAAAGAARSLVGFRSSIGTFVKSLGVLDFAILGFIAFEAIDSVIDGLDDDLDKTQAYLDSYKGQTLKSQNQLTQRAKELREQGGDPTFKDKLAKLNDVFNPVEIPKTIMESLKGEYDDPRTRRRRQLEQAEMYAAEIRSRRRMQEAQRGAGMPVQQLTAGELIRDLQRDQDDLEAGLISRREFRHRLALHNEELKTLLGKDADKQRARLALAGAARGGTAEDYAATLRTLKPEQLQQEAQAIVAVAEMTGRTAEGIRNLGLAYNDAVRRYAGHTDAASILALAQARDQFFKGIEEMVQNELQSALTMADSESDRRAAFARARGQYRRVTRPSRDRLEQANSDLEAAKRNRAFIKEQMENLLPNAEVNPLTGEPEFGGLPDTSGEQRLRKELDKANADVKRFRRQRKKFQDEFNDAKKKQNELQRELDRAAYSDRETGRNIQLQLRLSQTASGSEQARIQIRFAERQVRDAAETFGKNSREYRQALTNLNNARADAVQQMLADVDAENALMLAKAGNDPSAQNAARVQAETNRLNTLLRAQAQGRRVDPNAIKEQQAKVIEAKNQQQEQLRQDAETLANLQTQIAQARAYGDPVRQARIAVAAANRARARARTPIERAQALLDWINANNTLEQALAEREETRTDLLTSRTEDPVKITAIEERAARRAIKGTHGIERMQKVADYNRKKTAHRNAVIDSKEDDINFLLEMDKITNEEAAKRLEQLAKIKGISKAKKRELLLAAKRLRDEAEGEYNIDIGSIKLPTLYEIRRFVQGGMPTGPAGGTVNNNQSINITVNNSSDMQSVIDVLNANLNGTNKSIARNTGLR